MIGDTAPIILPDRVAISVRARLGMNGPRADVIVPLADMVMAIGDAMPLAILSRMLDSDHPDATVTLRSDGSLDSPDKRMMLAPGQEPEAPAARATRIMPAEARDRPGCTRTGEIGTQAHG